MAEDRNVWPFLDSMKDRRVERRLASIRRCCGERGRASIDPVHVDHLIYAAGPEGLDATAARVAEKLDTRTAPGGSHPAWGTHNTLIPLADRAYLEVVAVADPELAATTSFGAAVAAASAAGGGWVGWAVAVDDVDVCAPRLERRSAPGARRRPDGIELRWRTLATDVLGSDPDLPFLITWDMPDHLHPSAATDYDLPVDGLARLVGLELVGEMDRLASWLAVPADALLPAVDITWTPLSSETDGMGIRRMLAAHFVSPTKASVRL